MAPPGLFGALLDSRQPGASGVRMPAKRAPESESQSSQNLANESLEEADTKGRLPDRSIKLEEVSSRIGLGKTMICCMIREDRFPAPYKISPFAAFPIEIRLSHPAEKSE